MQNTSNVGCAKTYSCCCCCEHTTRTHFSRLFSVLVVCLLQSGVRSKDKEWSTYDAYWQYGNLHYAQHKCTAVTPIRFLAWHAHMCATVRKR